MADEPICTNLLRQVALAISNSQSLNDTLQAILEVICCVPGISAAAFRTLNPDANALELLAALPPNLPVSVPLSGGSAYDRVLNGESQVIPPAILAVPLRVRQHVLGSLDVYAANNRPLDERIVACLCAVASLAAEAIESAQLHQTLYSIAQALASSLELQPLLDQVLSATVLEMGLKAASVRLLDKSGKRLELVAAHGLSERYLSKGAVLVAKSPIDQKLLAGESVALYNVAEEPGFQYRAEAEAEGIRSVLAVPLKVKERIVGVMRVYSARPRPFTSVGVKFLQSVAGLVAVAIENARLYEALQQRYEGLKSDVSEWYKFLSLG